MNHLSHSYIPHATRRAYLFGGLRVEISAQAIAITAGKAQSLLAYLLLHPDTPHPRDVLADLLWPDAAPARVRRNLSDVLYRLRQTLGDNWLIVDAERVTLNVDADLWVDVWAFEHLSRDNDSRSLQEAIALYRGDLLPENYDDWLLPRRVTLHETYLDCVLRLARSAEQQHQFGVALEHYRRLAHADPLREQAQRGLMRSLARLGKLPEALQVYDDLVAQLQDELGIQPSADTRALADTLRNELELNRSLAMEAAHERSVKRFVGRTAERARMLDRLEQAHATQGGLMLLLGEAGIGKTRLLEELAQAADWRGWQINWGRGAEFTLPRSYAPLSAALEAALPKPRLQQLSQLVQPIWLSIASAMIPSIATATVSGETQQAHDPTRLALALRNVFDALQQIAPHLFILDDVQWSDAAMWPLLDHLRAVLKEMRVMLIIAGRADELRAQPEAWSLIDAWDRAGELLVPLRGLLRDELHELAVVYHRDDLPEAQLKRLQTASGGNPLLAIELLEAGDLDRLPRESSLVDLMLKRLNALPREALRALQAASAIGYRFDYQLWAAATDVPASALPALTGVLERNNLIALEAEGYRFAHDTLRAYVYTQIDATERAHLHRRVLNAMSRMSSGDAFSLLYHAEQAGDRAAIALYALQAGEQMLASFNYPAAQKYFAQALHALAPDERTVRFEVARGLARTLDVLSERDGQRRAVNLLQTLADELNDDRRRVEAAWHRANLEWITGQFAQAKVIAESGLELARRTNDVKHPALLLEIMGRSARDLGEYAQADECFVHARERYMQIGDEPGAAWIDGMLGIVAQRQGRWPQAIEYHTRAMNTHRNIGNPFNEMRAATGLAVTLWMTGDYPQARSIFEHTLGLSREVNDRRIEEASLANLGGLADILGDYSAAVELKQQALALSRASDNKMGVALGLSNLGITYYKLGQLNLSLTAFDEAIEIDRAIGRRQGEAYSLHGRGMTLFEMGRIQEARAALEQARAIRVELSERDLLLSTDADLALVALAEEEPADAWIHMQAALDSLQDDERADLREQAHYTAYRVKRAHDDIEAATQHLQWAQAAMLELADMLPHEARERFLQQDPLNRKVRAALAALAHKTRVQLARADVPLGRKLSPEDYVMVEWTLHLAADDAFDNPTERRRAILQRLLAEAKAQAAAPTDADLAHALGVSRRTILRDMNALAQSGVTLPTRRRRDT